MPPLAYFQSRNQYAPKSNGRNVHGKARQVKLADEKVVAQFGSIGALSIALLVPNFT